MLRLVLLVAVVALASAASVPFDQELDSHWLTFTQTYNKVYKPDEATYRRLVWEKHLRIIQNHNLEADMGIHSFTLGLNEHADLSDEEFNARMKGYNPNINRTEGSTFMPPSNVDIAAMVDWREKGYVTPIKDQKQCGSCWAFSATGSLEGQHFKQTGKLVSLSEQELVDCSKKEGNDGCGGGIMDQAFNYVKLHGISTEGSYPYTARDGKCKRGLHKLVHGANCTGHVDIARDSEKGLQAAVSTVGPISVAIDASTMTFRFYKHGVYHSKKCSSVRLDHGVLAVGYGTKEGKAYWIVKNSWGKSWGDKGYILMSRNMHNNCGIATQASYPLV